MHIWLSAKPRKHRCGSRGKAQAAERSPNWRGCSVSWQAARAFEHSDHSPEACPRPRRSAPCDRRGAEARRGSGRDHGAARAARRRQDDACGGLRRAPKGRLSRDLVDQGADTESTCAPISFRSACGLAGSPPTRKKNRRSTKRASDCGTRALSDYRKRFEAASARLLDIERDAPVKYRLEGISPSIPVASAKYPIPITRSSEYPAEAASRLSRPLSLLSASSSQLFAWTGSPRWNFIVPKRRHPTMTPSIP